jgi:predicted P-loop ATPase
MEKYIILRNNYGDLFHASDGNGYLVSDVDATLVKKDDLLKIAIDRGDRLDARIVALEAVVREKDGRYKKLLQDFDARRFEGGKQIAALTAENIKYREALEAMARQRIKKELTPLEHDNADYEYGFEFMIENARATLKPTELSTFWQDKNGEFHQKQTEGGGRNL